MSLSLQQAPIKKGASKPASAPAAGGGGGQQRGNTFVAEKLARAAEESETQGRPDYAATLNIQEDPGKFQIPEGPGDAPATTTTGGNTRPQQQDALPALRDKHKDRSYSDVKDGTAFVKGGADKDIVDPNDVAQGALGDCYLMAAMAATARANPEHIKKIIKDNGDGTYDVTLYVRKNAWSKPVPVTKKIDSRLPGDGSSNLYAGAGDQAGGKRELWPALLEKTLAQHKGSYEKIQGGQIATGFNFAGATELFTGKAESYQNMDNLKEDDVLLTLGAALEKHQTATVDSRDMEKDAAMSQEANKLNVYGNHAYAVESVDIDKRTVNLQNPWGSNHVRDLPVALLKKYYRGLWVGG